MSDGPVSQVFQRILAIAREESGTDVAWISRFADGEQQILATSDHRDGFEVQTGFAAAYDGSYCARVLDGSLQKVVRDAQSDPLASRLPVTDELGIGGYVGVPVRFPDGRLFGMLCCISRGRLAAEPPMRLLEALAQAAGEEAMHRHEKQVLAGARRQRIERALRERSLQTVLQPIVRLSRMQIIGVEALTRFGEAPSRPDVWFADAAEVGLGEELELLAIETALALLPALPADVYLSLNVSPAVAVSASLHRLLGTVDVARLTLELTEHSVVKSYDELSQALGPLRRAGMRLAVDDAGAGYASFNHILALRPDIIKLDTRLTRQIDGDPVKRSLAEALQSFASRSNAYLVAEGVETQEELDALLRVGATAVQGYFIARPAPLPLPPIAARPKVARGRASDEEAGLPVEDFVAFILSQLCGETGFEIAYLTVLHADTGLLEHRFTCPRPLEVLPEGLCIPWEQSICKRSRDAGIVWTADLANDLQPGYFGEQLGVKAFLSVPIRTPACHETFGTLCAVSFEPQYLSDHVVSRAERFARLLADRIMLEGVQRFVAGSETATATA